MLAGWDYSLFKWINDMNISHSNWNSSMVFFAEKGMYLLILGLCFYWLLRNDKGKKIVLQSLLSATIASLASLALGYLFHRDRPFVAHMVNQLFSHAADSSFPSDHATLAFALATTLFFHRRIQGVFWLAIAAFIAFGRVWCGVHYPMDIVFGATIGWMSALVVRTYLPSWTYAGILLTYIMRSYNYLEKKTINLVKNKLLKK
jgi:undecaprenyl-diphosphatase